MPKIKFNTMAAATGFMLSRVRRNLCEFLDNIPQSQLAFCIENKKMLTDFIPDEKRAEYKKNSALYYDIIEKLNNQLTDEQKFSYILTPKYQQFFSGVTGGKEWATKQLEIIIEFLLGT